MKERGNHSDEGSLGNTFHGGETCFNLFPSREAYTQLSACPAWERASLGLCLANCLPESVRYTLGPHGGAVGEEWDL